MKANLRQHMKMNFLSVTHPACKARGNWRGHRTVIHWMRKTADKKEKETNRRGGAAATAAAAQLPYIYINIKVRAVVFIDL